MYCEVRELAIRVIKHLLFIHHSSYDLLITITYIIVGFFIIVYL